MNATIRVFNEDGLQALAQAIVKQAADDWRMAMKRRRNPRLDTKENSRTIRETEAFINSAAPENLTGAYGPYIMSRLRREFPDAN